MLKNRLTEELAGRRRRGAPAFARHRRARLLALAFVLLMSLAVAVTGQRRTKPPDSQRDSSTSLASVPEETRLQILRAEDERRWSEQLAALLSDADARVRQLAALAAGRIGDERALPALITLLQNDRGKKVRSMAAFALGEVEAAASAEALLAALKRTGETAEVRARIIEAMGKVAGAIPPKTDEERSRSLGQAILTTLAAETQSGAQADKQVILLGLTAALRAHRNGAGVVVAKFLTHADARVRANAANALTRLRANDGNEVARRLLISDKEAIVRANAARVLGATEDKAAFDGLLARAVRDDDERVRVSSLRALGSLKDARAARPLLERAATLFASYRTAKAAGIRHPREAGELLEIATVTGGLLANTGDASAISWLREFRAAEELSAPEIEIAYAHIAPAAYLREQPFSQISDEAVRDKLSKNWRMTASLAQGLGQIAGITAEAAGSGVVGLQADAQITLRALVDDARISDNARPDLLRSLAAFKPMDAAVVLRKQLASKDVQVRATSADLLGELEPDEATTSALAASLPAALKEQNNDATLSILDALSKQKNAPARAAIKTALDSMDHLIRRRAVALLKKDDAVDLRERIGTVSTRNTVTDYHRALARQGKRVHAIVKTDKGSFTLELLAGDAPLTVDNFVQLARRGYFKDITFHRVVPNFVIQGGDPRGDGNGGPGYQIRCEINQVEYERGALGMALSGKDTGGSQWFVTHSPQPHLDGGYTVFGRVIAGMDVVDSIERGDHIRSITVTEEERGAAQRATPSRTRTGAGRANNRKNNQGR